MNNIESFNIAVAEVFGCCYKASPIRIEISVIKIGDAILETLNPNGTRYIDLRRPEHKIARASIEWLIKSKYLWNSVVVGFPATTSLLIKCVKYKMVKT